MATYSPFSTLKLIFLSASTDAPPKRLDRRAAKARRVDLAQSVYFENLHDENASCVDFCPQYTAPRRKALSIWLTLFPAHLTVL